MKRFFVLALFGVAACRAPVPEEAPPPPRAVGVAEVEDAAIGPPIRAAATVGGKAEAKLSFKIGGIVRKIRVNEGDRVRAGQVLAELDRLEIDAQVAQARRAHEKVARDRARVERLHETKVATLEQLQDLTTALEVAAEGLRVAEFNQRHARIVAPGSGRVLGRFAEEGELVGPGVPILRLFGDGDGWVVRAGLSEKDVVRLRIGDVAEVRLGPWPERPLVGTVRVIAGAATAATGTFEVELELPATELALRSGMTARIEANPVTSDRVRLIPIEAFLEGEGKQGSVFALGEDRSSVRRVRVESAFVHGDRLAIARGLEGVSRVVTDGASYLRDGQAVRVINGALSEREVAREAEEASRADR